MDKIGPKRSWTRSNGKRNGTLEKVLNMKLIVDSGATKTAWRSIGEDGGVIAAQSVGLNPSCISLEDLQGIIRGAIPTLNPQGRRIDEVHFYGAGLVSEEAAAPIRECLEMWCPTAEISFNSDMLAAARALFGGGSGIVAIMGTGSNSCLYENGKIIRNIRPGGYVLGDEGSGMALGKALLADFIKGLLPQHLEDEFIKEYGLDYPAIVRKIYREPAASAFMASLAPFVIRRLDEPYMKEMAENCIEDFVRRSLSRYEASYGEPLKVGVVGSFGCACGSLLKDIGARYGLEFIKFLKSPIDELVKYHGI